MPDDGLFHAVREPGGLWHQQAEGFRWEAPKAACDLRVLHPCEAATLTKAAWSGEFMCRTCWPSLPPAKSTGDADV